MQADSYCGTFASEQDLINHLYEECNYVSVKCTTCNCEVVRSEWHSCIDSLIDKCKALEESMKKPTRYYHCPNFHELSLSKEAKRRGMFTSGEKIKCHFCKLPIKLEEGYWTCT